MKHFKLAMICLSIALTATVVAEAEAGLFKKPAKGARTEKTEEQMLPRRFDNYPTMSFMSGMLSKDAHSGWKIGETPLYLHRDCVITMDGVEDAWLEEGRRATVMGSRVGGAISAWSINISQPAYKMIGSGGSEELKEAGPNPNVGRIIKPVE